MASKNLTAGSSAPGFTLPDSEGTSRSLNDFKGRWVVLYFYPRDNTSGCTLEAIDFTNRAADFKKRKALILGISPDSETSHRKFITKHGLGITLLSDSDRKVLELYGAWQLKKLYGKESYGVVRSTFLIDPEGVIRRVWDKVKVHGHVDEVFESLKELS